MDSQPPVVVPVRLLPSGARRTRRRHGTATEQPSDVVSISTLTLPVNLPFSVRRAIALPKLVVVTGDQAGEVSRSVSTPSVTA